MCFLETEFTENYEVRDTFTKLLSTVWLLTYIRASDMGLGCCFSDWLPVRAQEDNLTILTSAFPSGKRM